MELITKVNRAYSRGDQLELECQVGGQFINFPTLINVLRRLKGHPHYINKGEHQRLDIFFPTKSPYANIRCSIKGITAINTYCTNESINAVISQTEFIKKMRTDAPLYMAEYGIKFNLKSETPVLVDEAIVRELIINWKQTGKQYRLKKLFTFTSADALFAIDISIIKQNVNLVPLKIREVLERNLLQYVRKPAAEPSFKAWWARVSTNPDTTVTVANTSYTDKLKDIITGTNSYEIEVEYIPSHAPPTDSAAATATTTTTILARFASHICTLLQATEQSLYIMTQSAKNEVRHDLVRTFNAGLKEFAPQSNGRMRWLDESDIFIGPLIVDLEFKNLASLHNEADLAQVADGNIQLHYLVTEKADGDRYLLFVNKDGICHLIGRNESRKYSNMIKLAGATLPAMRNSLYDGEFITKLAAGQFVQHYYIFDAYMLNGENLMTRPFLINNEGGRHAAIRRMTDYIKTGRDITQFNARLPFLVFAKEYYASDTIRTYSNNADAPLIFQNCKKILSKINREHGGLLDGASHLFNYVTDGLVFLPNNLSIYQMSRADEPRYDILASSRRWMLNYKWKPLTHLSVDFRVRIDAAHATYLNSKRYARCTLYCKYFARLPLEDNGALLAYCINNGVDMRDIPEDMQFAPTAPFHGAITSDGAVTNYASATLLEIAPDDNIHCTNGDILIHGNTTEFVYDNTQPLDMRWRPIRNRTDKQANAVRTAYAIWDMINRPISLEWLTTGIPDEKYGKVAYYKEERDGRKYASHPFKHFSNYVKLQIIKYACGKWRQPSVMDLANGKMGDYQKFKQAGVHILIAIELFADNIHNRANGAARRLMEFRDASPRDRQLVDNTLLIQGDISKDIAAGTACADELNRYYIDVLYDRATANCPKLRRLANIGLEGFHVISCMFAIHYLFESEHTIRAFMMNVANNLRDGGLFIGTCLDGPTILESLAGKDRISLAMDGADIFTIERIAGVEYGALTTGQQINVYFETFAEMTPEYLVSIEYLSKLAEEYGMNMAATGLFMDGGGGGQKRKLEAYIADDGASDDGAHLMMDRMMEHYEMESEANKRAGAIIRKSPALAQWCAYHRYFIFQKK